MSETDPAPPATPPVAAPADPPPGVRCLTCGRTADCSGSQFLRYSRKGFPWCCGEAMAPQSRPGASTDCAAGVDKRLGHRRPARPRAEVEFRRGATGLGPNLAHELVDVSDDGLCVHLKESVTPGDEVEVAVGRPLGGKLHKRHARVRWCRPAWGSGFLVEVVFSKRLSIVEVNEVAQ